LKASSVGANTVNGPGLLRIMARSAAFTAATSFINLPSATAVCTISFCTGTCVDVVVGVVVTDEVPGTGTPRLDKGSSQ